MMDVRRICMLLAPDGINVAPSDVRIEARDDRWAAWLRSDAWFGFR
jgi:hypothetical protein